MICAAFGAIAVVIQRQRDGRNWRLRLASADLAGYQVFFDEDEDEEGPPRREAPVRFPGSPSRRLSGREGTGGQADAGEGRQWRSRAMWGFAGGPAARGAVIRPRFRADRAALGADLRYHPARTGRRRARSEFSSPARWWKRKIVPGPFMNRHRMPVALRKTGDRGEPTTRCSACSSPGKG